MDKVRQYGGNAYTLHVNEDIPMDRAQEIEDGFKELHSGLYEWGEKVFNEALVDGYISSVDGWRLYLPKFKEYKILERKVNNITREQWTLYRIGKSDRQREYKIQDYNKTREKDQPLKVFVVSNQQAYDFYRKSRMFISQFFKSKSEYMRLCLNNPIQTRGAHQMKLALCLIFEWILENNLIDIVLMCNAIHDEVVLECPEGLKTRVNDFLGATMVKAGNHYLNNLTIKADSHFGSNWGNAKSAV